MTARNMPQSLTVCILLFATTLTIAQDDVASPAIEVPELRVEDTLLNDLMPAKKARLGLVIEELAPQLASHLNVSEGVYVASVDADGPADQAGIASGDVIIMVDEMSIKTISDLMAAVAKSDGAKMSLTLDGQKGRRTTEVTPMMVTEKPVRPMDFDDLETPMDQPRLPAPNSITGDVIQQLMDQFGQRLNGRTLDDLGGLADQLLDQSQTQDEPLPKHLRIELQRRDDNRAEVTVEIDGKTFKTDSENLDTLPDDVRSRVEALLNRRPGARFDFGGWKIDLNQPRLRGNLGRLDPPSLGPKPFRPRGAAPGEPAPEKSTGIEDLRSEIDQLRKELRTLREDLKPSHTDLRDFD